VAKNLNPKCKQCRRAGEKLFLKSDRCKSTKCAMVKKNYPPGAHGTKRASKQSNYGIQLAEKQKLKRQYNLLEKQFKITFKRAKKQTGDVGKNFLQLLEQRLDNVIYRSGLAASRNEARQLVSHNHFIVNGKKVNIPSFQVEKGNIIEIKDKSKKSKIFNQTSQKLKNYVTPSWMNLDAIKLSVKILHEPKEEDLKNIKINMQMIVEYYSR